MSAGRNRTRTLLAAGAAVVVALAVSGCGGSDVSDAPVEHRSFAFGGKALTIIAENSALTLVPADVKDVEVARQVDGWVVLGSGPNASWKMSGSTLTLRLKCKALVSDCNARNEVKVPRGVAVTVDGDNGSVKASGFDTPLTLGSDNGSVTVEDSSGPLRLTSDNGKISTARITATSVHARSNNGSVQLALSAVPDLVDTVSDNGRIVIDLPASATRYAVTARSENGSADVRVPTSPSSAHVLKAHSSNGQVTVRTVN